MSAILERIETVLQADPLNLTLAQNPFTDETVPNTLVAETVRVQSGGTMNDLHQSNNSVARLERVSVIVQRPMQFEAYEAQRDLHDLLDRIERAVINDGDDHSYMASVEKGSRKIARKKDSDLYEASIHFRVDFDFSQAN